MSVVVNWFDNFFKEIPTAISWLSKEIIIGDYSFTPLVLLSLGGLIAFVAVAVVFWVVK